MKAGIILFQVFVVSLFTSTASAWDTHESLVRFLPPHLNSKTLQRLETSYSAKDDSNFHARYASIAQALQLNLAAPLHSRIEANPTFSGMKLLRISVDDPDFGMDQELDARMDPQQDRHFMGGEHGPTSQGFRHMFFGGWDWRHPIATFQIPLRPLGQAPDRAALLAQFSRQMIEGDEMVWGIRTLGWALHFFQDLAQPFHATQIPNLRMVPWKTLFIWPPSKAFEALVRETTRTIANYHWAYEGYVLHELEKPRSALSICLGQASGSAIEWPEHPHQPKALALQVAAESRKLSSEVGAALLEAFGSKLKEPRFDLAHNIGLTEYDRHLSDPANAAGKMRLDTVTCKALKNALDASAKVLDWALRP